MPHLLPPPLRGALKHGHGLPLLPLTGCVVAGEPGLGLPAGVGLGGERAGAEAAGDVGALLVEGGGLVAGVAEPLVPEGAYLDGGEVGGAGVLDDAAPAGGGVGVVGEAEDPVGVALEVGAWGFFWLVEVVLVRSTALLVVCMYVCVCV